VGPRELPSIDSKLDSTSGVGPKELSSADSALDSAPGVGPKELSSADSVLDSVPRGSAQHRFYTGQRPWVYDRRGMAKASTQKLWLPSRKEGTQVDNSALMGLLPAAGPGGRWGAIRLAPSTPAMCAQ
jgi:hypothetical protein